MSTAPSATSMWDQKSPNPRVRQTAWLSERKPVEPARFRPAADARVGERGVGQLADLGDLAARCLGQRPARPGAAARRRPPAPSERRRGDHAHHDLVPVHQPDERGPDGDAADVVLRRVDRVEHPAPRPAAGLPGLLAEHGVARPGPAQDVAQRVLGRPVGVGDRRQVGLGLDPQVERAEPLRRDVIGGVSEDVREPQVVIVGCHPRNATGTGIRLTSGETNARTNWHRAGV